MLMLRIHIVPDEHYIQKKIPKVKHRYVFLRNNLPKILNPILKKSTKQIECEIWEFEEKKEIVYGQKVKIHKVIPNTMTSYTFSYVKGKIIKGFKTRHQIYLLT